MTKTENRKPTPVTLIAQIPESLQADMKRHGLWRCNVLVPDCPKKPYAQIYRKSVKMHGLFCLKHTLHFASIEGLTVPLPEWN